VDQLLRDVSLVFQWLRAFVPLAIVAVALTPTGCGRGQSQGELLTAEQTVQTALETWRSGKSASSLKASTPPIEFHDDDWQRGARLVDFQIVKTYLESDGTPRCSVQFTIQLGAKAPEKRRATYQLVNKGNAVVVARDPFS
jgi:hypothetical protein